MAEEELQTVKLRDDFYRDSFQKVILTIISLMIAICALIALSIYLHVTKPPPVTFFVDDEWRVQPPVALDKPYLTLPDMLQWVTDTMRTIFVFDFVHFNDQVKRAAVFFTDDGYKVFMDQLNIYANYNTVLTNKLFVNGFPSGAPFLLNQGLLSGRYAWWVQMPFTLNYAGNRYYSQELTLQILVVRVSTLNNLNGVLIDNMIVVKSGESKIGNR